MESGFKKSELDTVYSSILINRHGYLFLHISEMFVGFLFFDSVSLSTWPWLLILGASASFATTPILSVLHTLFKWIIWMLQCLHVQFIGFEIDILGQPLMLSTKIHCLHPYWVSTLTLYVQHRLDLSVNKKTMLI